MPIEYSQLKGKPIAKRECPVCGLLYTGDFMRGMIQSNIRRLLGMKYCAIICHACKATIGWEKP